MLINCVKVIDCFPILDFSGLGFHLGSFFDFDIRALAVLLDVSYLFIFNFLLHFLHFSSRLCRLIMPFPPLDDHERCALVCVVCYKKGNRSLTEKQTNYIRENLIYEFAIDNPDFPAAICCITVTFL